MSHWKRVHTINAPQGAITTQKALKRHLRRGGRLFQFTVDSYREVEIQRDFVIVYLGGLGPFLYASREAHRLDIRWHSLTDRHIGTNGYNNNWFFSSAEAAERYKLNNTGVW